MVTHRLTNKTSVFNGFNRFSKFVLIGNNIDGRVNVGIDEFSNYQEAMAELPGIIRNLEFGGEWNLSFYQIPDDFRIKMLYGYYKVPKKGKRVFEFGYMQAGEQNEIFLTPGLIHISCITKDIRDKWEDGQDHLNFEIYEEYFTIMLKEELDGRSFMDEDYPGDITALHKEAWKLN